MTRAVALMVVACAAVGCGSGNLLDGSTVIWKDQAGVTAPDVFGDPDGPVFYRDPRGFFWRVDTDTLVVRAAIGLDAFGTFPAYESADCSGTQFVIANAVPEPRVTFLAPDDPAVHVRPDTLLPVSITRCSAMTGTGCMPVAGGACDMHDGALPTKPMLPDPPALVPVLLYGAPLHPEFQ